MLQLVIIIGCAIAFFFDFVPKYHKLQAKERVIYITFFSLGVIFVILGSLEIEFSPIRPMIKMLESVAS